MNSLNRNVHSAITSGDFDAIENILRQASSFSEKSREELLRAIVLAINDLRVQTTPVSNYIRNVTQREERAPQVLIATNSHLLNPQADVFSGTGFEGVTAVQDAQASDATTQAATYQPTQDLQAAAVQGAQTLVPGPSEGILDTSLSDTLETFSSDSSDWDRSSVGRKDTLDPK